MTDSHSPLDPNAQPPAQSPLDMLEKILNDSKAGGTDPAAVTAAPQSDQPVLPSDDQKLREIHALEAQQQVADAAALEQKKSELAAIKETPEYQARVQQDQAKQQADASQQAAGEGFEINQLGHKKI